MSLLSRDEAKQFLQVDSSDSALDATLDDVLPALEDFVCKYCHSDFTNTAGEPVFPVGLKLAAGALLRHYLENRGVAAESLGDYSVSFFVDIPHSILLLFKPFKQVSFT